MAAAFSRANVELPQGAVKLQLWDTAGQEKYKALVRIYYRGAAAAIVTFDVSNKVGRNLARLRLLYLLYNRHPFFFRSRGQIAD